MAKSSSVGWPACALIFNAFVWGIAWWPLRQLQLHGLHPLWSTALVFLVVLLSITLVRPQALRNFAAHPQLWWLVAAAGLTNVGFNWGVTIGDVVRVVLLFYLMPAWAVLLAWALLGERPTRVSMLRLVVAMLGVLLVLKSPQSPWPVPRSLADYLGLMGGVCFAATNVLLSKYKHTPNDARAWAMFVGGACMSTVAALMGWGLDLVPTPALQWAGLPVALGLCVAFCLSNMALQYGAAHLPASTTSLIMLSEVLFASVSAAMLGAADLEGRTLLGGGLIVLTAAHAALHRELQRRRHKRT